MYNINMQILNKNKFILGILKSSFLLLIAFFIVNPVFAVPCTGQDPNTGKPTPPGCVEAAGIKIKTGINNPLHSDLDTIPKFIEAVLNIVLMVGVPIVTLAIIYAGFLFVTAGGNSEKLKVAKKTLLYTIVGAALLLGSWVISEAIAGTVDEIKNVNNSKVNGQ